MRTWTSMRAGQWYRMTTGAGSWKKLTVIGPAAGVVRVFDGRGLSGPLAQFRAIDEGGFKHEVTAHDVGRLGIGGLEYLPEEEESTPETIAALEALGEANREAIKEVFKKQGEEREAERATLPALYPQLVPTAKSGKTPWANGAANIRRELAQAFPAVKFSVKSEAYSGGCSIDIKWQDGPTTDQVREITDKYAEGDFDGMTDSYNYNNVQFSRVFGGAKYVMPNRSMTVDGLREAWKRAGNDPADVIVDERGDWNRWAQAQGVGDQMHRVYFGTSL